MASLQSQPAVELPDLSARDACQTRQTSPTWTHRDGLGRHSTPARIEGSALEPFLDPTDARLKYFVPQPHSLRISDPPWIYSVLDWTYFEPGTKKCGPNAFDGASEVRQRRRSLIGVWPAGALGCLLGLCTFQGLSVNLTNGGKYDPVLYREWLYAKIPRNPSEARGNVHFPATDYSYGDGDSARPLLHSVGPNKNDRQTSGPTNSLRLAGDQQVRHVTISAERELGPKVLCFVNDNSAGYETMRVEDWMHTNKTYRVPDFVFVSYTRRQFVVDSAAQVQERYTASPQTNAAALRRVPADRLEIARYGVHAARQARLPAFWLDFECLKPNVAMGEDERHMGDVYRISDIVRVSAKMIVACGPSWYPDATNDEADWLLEWGTRLWCVPEALLCPTESFELYTRARDLRGFSCESIFKRNLATIAFKDTAERRDASNMRQLIDHYEGSLVLTPLELVSIAFDSLRTRHTEMRQRGEQGGDAAYALMGLLRRRPDIFPEDSSFEAFARLSLANDSNMLLERLLCMQAVRHRSPWHDMRDAWHANLWDIEPHCQVAGIVDSRTVVLDGAFGASIHWGSLRQVAFVKRETPLRKIAKVLVRVAPLYLLLSIVLFAISRTVDDHSEGKALRTWAGVILAFTLCLISLLPAFLSALYLGKFWSTQAKLFGIEGVPDLGYVEKCVFGINENRLRWSATGSLLSRHEDRNGERFALPPQPLAHADKRLRLFTIVDTFTMTASSFYAEKPPSVALVCGREGGMQRAVLCSYEAETQTYCREAVLRMKTLVLDRMSRVDRFRFCLTREGRVPAA